MSLYPGYQLAGFITYVFEEDPLFDPFLLGITWALSFVSVAWYYSIFQYGRNFLIINSGKSGSGISSLVRLTFNEEYKYIISSCRF